MKRRDFLKGLSGIVPASLLAKLALPKVEEVASVEAPPSDEFNGVWFQDGGRITDVIYFTQDGGATWDARPLHEYNKDA